MTSRDDIARLRVRANRAIDELFTPIAAQMTAALAQHVRTGTDGVARIDAHAALLMSAEVRRLLNAKRAALILAVLEQLDAARELASDQVANVADTEILPTDQPSRSAEIIATIGALVAGALIRAAGQTDRVLTDAVVTQPDPTEVITRITLYFDPDFSSRRTVGGDLIRDGRPGAFTDWPAASGMGSSGVRAIAEHEIYTAHGDEAIIQAQRLEGVGILWELSPWHTDADECDDNANTDSGFGPGVFRSDEVPEYPSHVRCSCVLSPVPLERAEIAP